EPRVVGADDLAADRMATHAALVDRLAARGIAGGEGGAVDGKSEKCHGVLQTHRLLRRRKGAAGLRGDSPAAAAARIGRCQDQEMKAVGTGFSPSALRSTAQCIVSSPRMLAAALGRSLVSKTG